MQKSFDADKGRGGFDNNYTLSEFIKITLDKLINDKNYQNEYTDFVGSMSYAKDSDVITFKKALKYFEKLYEFINKNT